MAFDKIYDFAWVTVIIGIIVITMGYGVQSAIQYSGSDYDTSFFDNIGGNVSERLNAAGAGQEAIISGSEGSGELLTTEKYFSSGIPSLFSLGGTWVAIRDAMSAGIASLGVPAVFLALIMSALLITFAAILYSWIRGNG